VTLYDPAREQWRVLDAGSDSSNMMDGFVEDPRGTIWLTTGSALIYYDEESQHPVVAASLPFDPIGPKSPAPDRAASRPSTVRRPSRSSLART
jgi:hypothetical protein